jgi:phosphomannomutase
MAPQFGTSGLRGLVEELTPDLVADYVRAFVRSCPMGTGLWVGRDLRASSPDIGSTVLAAARGMGLATVDCGAVPTPALALVAMKAGAAAIMVTGSHIPEDRNGLKFYLPSGEVSKENEGAILASLGRPHTDTDAPPTLFDDSVGLAWVARYVGAFGPSCLAGMRLGIWSQSAVSRDLLLTAMTELGATALELGRSDVFIPIDTEAISAQARTDLKTWAQEHALDAILSTDGDGDRPLLTDASGCVIPGDVLGQITAAVLDADVVVTPVSSNSGVSAPGRFARTIITRIGSPFVIAGMATAGVSSRVVGYEANGGFLLGFTAQGPAGPLPPLATRDSLLPMIALLSRARIAGGVAALVAAEPARFTATDRLKNIAPDRSTALVDKLRSDSGMLAAFLAALGEVPASTDETDGLRVLLASGRILHVRPSGNAPELRLYVEAETTDIAGALLAAGLDELSTTLSA